MKEPIRIAHIIGKWVGGGVEAVVMNYYRHIDHTKIQFDFICDNDSTNIPYQEIEKLGGKVILIPPYQRVLKYHCELKKILKEGDYKIVHSHINTLSVFSLFAAKCAKVPVRIAHSHSTTNKKEFKRNILKQLLRPYSKLFATNYMCCSELSGRWLFGNKTYNKGSVYLLNNAIDLNKFKYDEKIRKAKRKELGISDNTLVIGHIGRFVPLKNHEFIIKFFQSLSLKKRNLLLILVGQGPLEEKIKKQVSNLNLTSKVLFLGQRNDVNELYQAFDFFILPSLYEGLGVTLIEAQVAGLYSFASTFVPQESNLTQKVIYLDLNNNPEIWANTTLECLSNIERSSDINIIRNKGYDIEKEVQKLSDIYLNLITRSSK